MKRNNELLGKAMSNHTNGKSKESHHPSRREFLKTGAISTFLLGTGVLPSYGRDRVLSEGSAKNVIFLVSDGMSSGTLALADILKRRREGNATHWARLYEEGRARRSLMDMASADRIVTDSAAAASSWGCGHRINNGGVNYGVNGEMHKPVLPVFSDAGKSTGLVTTTRITHATPAGFAANVEARGMEDTIAEQYLQRNVDVLLGGGNRHFDPQMRDDNRNLYQEYEQAGYDLVRNKQELQRTGTRNRRLLGTFSDGHLPYSIDHANIREYRNDIPTLSEMTETALEELSRNDRGFILQVEGGRVDHAAHGNCVAGMLYDQIAFDDAIGTACSFAENRDDTLVIITTDHGNANPGLNSGPDEKFDTLQQFRHSFSWIHSELNEDSTLQQIRERVEAATNFQITAEEAQVYLDATKGTYKPVYNEMSGRASVLGQIVANYTNVNWIGGSHTSDYVELAAFGPGCEAIKQNGLVRNTDLFDIMTEAAGVAEFAES